MRQQITGTHSDGLIRRRGFLQKTAGSVLAMCGLSRAGTSQETSGMAEDSSPSPDPEPFFLTRGVVVQPVDIKTWTWPEKAKEAGLSTIATHPFPRDIIKFVKTDAWQAFYDACRRKGVQVEHELHAMAHLLPRDLFKKDPSMFPMNKKGERIPSYNLCVHSKAAVEVVCENVVKFARLLPPTTGRHFYWIDDGRPMCRCPKCRGLSDSDQALLLENRMIKAIRRANPRDTLAHLSYHNTLTPPKQIKPEPGIFLEWAPISRRFDTSIGDRSARKGHHGQLLDSLTANIEVFGSKDAQVLEYWLDESLFYRANKRKPAKIPWDRRVFLDDLNVYGKLGIRHITTFAVYVNGDYVKRFGEPPLNEYGQGLLNWSPS